MQSPIGRPGRHPAALPWWCRAAVVCLVALPLLWWPQEPHPQTLPGANKRVALLIGNAAYNGSMPPLTQPPQDVAVLAASLVKLGFTVQTLNDADQKAMGKALRSFGETAREAQVALVYYSGHGVQSRDQNYLIPVGASIASEADLELEAVALKAVLRQIEDAAPRTTIVVLDACRDNPLPSRTKSGTKGLGRVRDAPKNTLVVYATQPGTTAKDNGVLARELSRQLLVPNLGVRSIFDRVSLAVLDATNQEQLITRDDQLLQEIVLLEAAPATIAGPGGAARDARSALDELRARTATDRRWIDEFARVDDGELSPARLDQALQGLAKGGNAIAAAELVKTGDLPNDELAAKVVKQLAPAGLAALQRLADDRHPKAMGWLAQLYLDGDRDLEVAEDAVRGRRLMEAAVRLNEPKALWQQVGLANTPAERLRLLTELSKLTRNRYACLAMVGAQWRDPGETGIWSLAYSVKEHAIKSFLVYAKGASYTGMGYPTGRVAVDWMSRAFESGCEAASAFAVGHAQDPYTPHEPGVAKDARKALDWYQRSVRQGEEVGGWVPYRLFVLHALGANGVNADRVRARSHLERVFQVDEPEPWGLLDDLLDNSRLSGIYLTDFVDLYVKWLLVNGKSASESTAVADEARRLMRDNRGPVKAAGRQMCQRAMELKNEPCRQWLAEN